MTPDGHQNLHKIMNNTVNGLSMSLKGRLEELLSQPIAALFKRCQKKMKMRY